MSKYLGRIEQSQIGDHIIELHRNAPQDDLHRMSAFGVKLDNAMVISGRMPKTAADYAYQAIIATVEKLT